MINSGTRYRPWLSAPAGRTIPVSTFRTSTLAAAITAPEGSVIVPDIVAVVVCALSSPAAPKEIRTIVVNKPTNRFRLLASLNAITVPPLVPDPASQELQNRAYASRVKIAFEKAG